MNLVKENLVKVVLKSIEKQSHVGFTIIIQMVVQLKIVIGFIEC